MDSTDGALDTQGAQGAQDTQAAQGDQGAQGAQDTQSGQGDQGAQGAQVAQPPLGLPPTPRPRRREIHPRHGLIFKKKMEGPEE